VTPTSPCGSPDSIDRTSSPASGALLRHSDHTLAKARNGSTPTAPSWDSRTAVIGATPPLAHQT
jgi:hypothetical protein